jgi:hypothetical protein
LTVSFAASSPLFFLASRFFLFLTAILVVAIQYQLYNQKINNHINEEKLNNKIYYLRMFLRVWSRFLEPSYLFYLFPLHATKILTNNK